MQARSCANESWLMDLNSNTVKPGAVSKQSRFLGRLVQRVDCRQYGQNSRDEIDENLKYNPVVVLTREKHIDQLVHGFRLYIAPQNMSFSHIFSTESSEDLVPTLHNFLSSCKDFRCLPLVTPRNAKYNLLKMTVNCIDRFRNTLKGGASGSTSSDVHCKMGLEANPSPEKRHTIPLDSLGSPPLKSRSSSSISRSPLSDLSNYAKSDRYRKKFRSQRHVDLHFFKGTESSTEADSESSDDEWYNLEVASKFPVGLSRYNNRSIGSKSLGISGRNCPQALEKTKGPLTRRSGVEPFLKNTTSQTRNDPTESGSNTLRASSSSSSHHDHLLRILSTSDNSESSEDELYKAMLGSKYPVVVLDRILPSKDSFGESGHPTDSRHENHSLARGHVSTKHNGIRMGPRANAYDKSDWSESLDSSDSEHNCLQKFFKTSALHTASSRASSSPQHDRLQLMLRTSESSDDESSEDELLETMFGSKYPVVMLNRIKSTEDITDRSEGHPPNEKFGSHLSSAITPLLKNSSQTRNDPTEIGSGSNTLRASSSSHHDHLQQILRTSENSDNDETSENELYETILGSKYPVVVLDRIKCTEDITDRSEGHPPNEKFSSHLSSAVTPLLKTLRGSSSSHHDHLQRILGTSENCDNDETSGDESYETILGSKYPVVVLNGAMPSKDNSNPWKGHQHGRGLQPTNSVQRNCSIPRGNVSAKHNERLVELQENSNDKSDCLQSCSKTSGLQTKSSHVVVPSNTSIVSHTFDSPVATECGSSRSRRPQRYADISPIKRRCIGNLTRFENEQLLEISLVKSERLLSSKNRNVMKNNFVQPSTSCKRPIYSCKRHSQQLRRYSHCSQLSSRVQESVRPSATVNGLCRRKCTSSISKNHKPPKTFSSHESSVRNMSMDSSRIANPESLGGGSETTRFKMAMKRVWNEFEATNETRQFSSQPCKKPKTYQNYSSQFRIKPSNSWPTWTREQLSDFMKIQSSVSSQMPSYFSSNEKCVDLTTLFSALAHQ